MVPLVTDFEKGSSYPQSPQVSDVFGGKLLQPGFSDLFESGTEVQKSTPYKQPSGGLGLSKSFLDEVCIRDVYLLHYQLTHISRAQRLTNFASLVILRLISRRTSSYSLCSRLVSACYAKLIRSSKGAGLSPGGGKQEAADRINAICRRLWVCYLI